jgi:hypothetical protein
VRNGRLSLVSASIDSVTGDTLVNGRPLRQFYSPGSAPYATATAWYARDEPIRVGNRQFFKNGPPLNFSPYQLRDFGVYRGISVFVLAEESDGRPSTLFVLLAPNCTFQAYYFFDDARG